MANDIETYIQELIKLGEDRILETLENIKIETQKHEFDVGSVPIYYDNLTLNIIRAQVGVLRNVLNNWRN